MDKRTFFQSLRRAREFLSEIGLLRDARDFKSFEPPEAFKKASRPEITYGELFRIGLETTAYTYLLDDFSYFQLRFEERGIGYEARFAYYPNPFVDDDAFHAVRQLANRRREDALEALSQVMAETQENVRIPMIRYEVDRPAYRPLAHPFAHVHLGTHEENRWAVSIALTPCVFVHQMIKMFHPTAWAKGVQEQGQPNVWDARLCQLKQGCEPIPEEFFSSEERGQIHFA